MSDIFREFEDGLDRNIKLMLSLRLESEFNLCVPQELETLTELQQSNAIVINKPELFLTQLEQFAKTIATHAVEDNSWFDPRWLRLLNPFKVLTPAMQFAPEVYLSDINQIVGNQAEIVINQPEYLGTVRTNFNLNASMDIYMQQYRDYYYSELPIETRVFVNCNGNMISCPRVSVGVANNSAYIFSIQDKRRNLHSSEKEALNVLLDKNIPGYGTGLHKLSLLLLLITLHRQGIRHAYIADLVTGTRHEDQEIDMRIASNRAGYAEFLARKLNLAYVPASRDRLPTQTILANPYASFHHLILPDQLSVAGDPNTRKYNLTEQLLNLGEEI